MLGDGEEEILGIHVFIDQVHAPFLMSKALSRTALDETGVLGLCQQVKATEA